MNVTYSANSFTIKFSTTLNFRFWAIVLSLFSAGALSAQLSVSSFGAIGNGVTDDTAGLRSAINSLPLGATLDFGNSNKVYVISSTLVFLPSRSYQGRATIQMSRLAPLHTPIAILSYGSASNVSLSGLTFDSNGVGGGINIAVGAVAAIPASNVLITNMTFLNAPLIQSGPWDGAIYDPVGLVNSQIINNRIRNCGNSIFIMNANQTTISGNEFLGIRYSDAIYLTFLPAPFVYGQGINISQNSGQHLGRMAIELWSNGAQTSQVQGAVISGNTFSDWDAGWDPEPFGISIQSGVQMTVQNNSLLNGVAGTGIELGAPNSIVQQNTVVGFPLGMTLNNAYGSQVLGNVFVGQTSIGIEFTNAPESVQENITVSNNRIINAQSFGILVNSANWGSSTISGNSIWRAGGYYPTDPTQPFTGIGISPPDKPVVVSGNSVIQSSATPPVSFSFTGIRVNGAAGSNASSSYTGNVVFSWFATSPSIGIFSNSGGSLDGATVQNNTFQGLQSASGGATSGKMNGGGNLTINCGSVGPLVVNQ